MTCSIFDTLYDLKDLTKLDEIHSWWLLFSAVSGCLLKLLDGKRIYYDILFHSSYV